jgi:Fe2+ or Zn2+ uptake regulation protein
MKNKILIRRGRPDKRDFCRTYILAFLKQSGLATVDYIRKELQKKGISFSWATIKKYLDELIEENQVKIFEPTEPSRKKYNRSRIIYFYGSLKEASNQHSKYVKSNL